MEDDNFALLDNMLQSEIDEDFIDGRPIGHFFQFLSCKPAGSENRKTYGENIEISFRNFQHTSSVPALLEKIFKLLIKRLTLSNNLPGQPRFISVSVSNEFMETPFFVPFRF